MTREKEDIIDIVQIAKTQNLQIIDVVGGWFAINEDKCLFVFDFSTKKFVEVYKIEVMSLVPNSELT